MAQGRIEIIRDFHSPPEHATRTLRIYVPVAATHAPSHVRFPLAVMQDAQNLFDHPEQAMDPSWGVNSSLDWLIETGRVPPVFVVGVDHRGVDRIGDFSPWPSRGWAPYARGDRYVDFLVQTLLPWARQHLPVTHEARHTLVAGSSMGGLISLYAGLRHPERFGLIGAFSPTVMAADRKMFQAWSGRRSGQRIYLDAGEHERFRAGEYDFDYGGTVRDFAEQLESLGYARDLRAVLEPHGTHDERSWRRRFPEAIRWLLT